jgi:DNA-binding transcriptional regulator LsrR (DeoR family)
MRTFLTVIIAMDILSKIERELLVRVSRLRYVDDLTQKEIGDKLAPKRRQSAVSKLLDQGKPYRLARHEIDADAAITGDRDPVLSYDLCKDFALESAEAVKVAEDLDDDGLHVALANYTAEVVRPKLRSDDHLAVAGGRTIARLCSALTHAPVDVNHVVVTPLGGRLWSGHLWRSPSRGAEYLEQPLNPDDCALILARGLHAGVHTDVTFSQVSHPLFARSEAEAIAIIKENCAFRPRSGWNWGLGAPSHAFVGVGELTTSTHHRLAEWLKRGQKLPFLSPLSQIGKALDSAKRAELPPFGDVANRVFISLPLPSELPQNPTDRTALMETIRRLDNILLEVNRKSVVMDWDHLRDIPSVTAIAGGTETAPKTHALWTLLLATSLFEKEAKFRLLTSLTTDSGTAQILTQERAQLEKQGEATKSWYRNALTVLFPKHRNRSARARG